MIDTNYSELKEFFDNNQKKSFLETRFSEFAARTQRVESPDVPRYIQVEVTNICNHSCNFCAYTRMERRKRHMDRALFERIVLEAYAAGAREIGLFSGSEPLTCKSLEDYVTFCRQAGYDYIYISTNGSLGGPDRFRRLLDAGLSSIKFSVNGGTRESYLKTHGADHFDKVCETIRFVSSYRKTLPHPVFLGISYVACAENEGTFDGLAAMFDGVVDEVVRYEAANQSGQMPDLPPGPARTCDLPFNKLHVSVEGYLRACCNDYENALAVEDLNTQSLTEAWRGDRFRDLRTRHLTGRLGGTLCDNCLNGCHNPVKPLNPDLSTLTQSTHYQPKRP